MDVLVPMKMENTGVQSNSAAAMKGGYMMFHKIKNVAALPD